MRPQNSPAPALRSPRRREIVLTDGARVQLRPIEAGDDERFALVAIDPSTPDRMIGMADYLRDPVAPAVAEMSVVVADAWQWRGLGTILVAAVAEVAAQNGVRAFLVEVPAANRPVVSILRRFGAEISPGAGDGVLDAHMNLPSNRNAFRDVIRSASAGRPGEMRRDSGWVGPAIAVMGESLRFGASLVELQAEWTLSALTLLAPRTI